MRYMETGSTDPCFNLAFEEYQLQHRTDGDSLILWQNENTIVVGLNQNTAEEINSDYVGRRGIRVVRRSTGGGAVYHDLGNLNYSFLTDAGAQSDLSLGRFSALVCGALRRMGVPAEVGGRNDILVAGKKVSGSAQRLCGGRLLHHGCLLFRSDPEVIASALRPDPLKFASKSAKSVRSRVGNIGDYLSPALTIFDFWQQLRQCLTAECAAPYTPGAGELAEIRRLADEKYRSRDWTWGRSPDYTVSGKQRYPGGIVAFQADVQAGKVRSIAFFGDYLARVDATGLTDALSGLWFAPEEISAVLDRFPLADIFGGIAREELLDLLFPADRTDSETGRR